MKDIDTMPAEQKVSVIIIGAGPSGLALAIELGTRGVSVLVVERNDRVGVAPRAKTTNVRTRTHLRRWGIADQLAAVSPMGVDYPASVKFVTRLAGYGLAHIENSSNCEPGRSDLYPEHAQWVPQYKLEQVLRERADELPSVELRFGVECVAASQDGSGVEMTLRDRVSGDEARVRSAYAVGADGARSRVRQVIGATMTGQPVLSRNYNIVFRARGLADAHGHGPAIMYWQVNDAIPSLIGPMDEGDIWFFMPTRLPEGFTITPENAAGLLREATGIEMDYEVLSSDEWVASSLIADKYRDGRLFLIGDACHLHPPFGGYGMNMGVADGVDLGWKLAATIQGWAGAPVLDSYEVERRQIHEAVIAEAAANHAVLSNDLWSDALEQPGEAGDVARRDIGEKIVALKEREFHTLGTVLGGCYRHSPILPAPSDAAMNIDSRVYVPSSAPGCLAPHIWRANGEALYDLFGQGFALVAGPAASDADIAAAVNDAEESGVPFVSIRLASEEAEGRYPAPLTLVRPDQFVAWRGAKWSREILLYATGRGQSVR